MKNATALTTSEWLALTDSSARDIFAGSAQDIQALYRKLVQRWHPDRNPDPSAKDVFVRIQVLHGLAAHTGTVSKAGAVFEVTDHQGRKFRFQGTQRTPFELGNWGRGAHTFAYQVSAANQDLFENHLKVVSSLRFENDAMRTVMRPLLPEIAGHPWGAEGGLLVIKHDPKSIRLRDLYEHAKDSKNILDPLHLAWILSGLFNLACYLEYQGIAHHAIDLDNVWVCPERHETALLGGWFYAKPFGETLTALPTSSVNMASAAYLTNKKAAAGFDLELIRALGRELLGDRRGQRLTTDHAPAPIVKFLQLPSAPTAVDDYRRWKEALKASFGPPKFVPMNVSASHIYTENCHG